MGRSAEIVKDASKQNFFHVCHFSIVLYLKFYMEMGRVGGGLMLVHSSFFSGVWGAPSKEH